MTSRAVKAPDAAITTAVVEEVRKRVVGQEAMIERLLVGLLTGGHILLEGVPGLAKTLAVRTLAEVIRTTFQRIQFTPDLLPADIIGTMVFDQRTGDFRPKRGPLFTNILLADEINRAPAKVQAALLEAMQEKQVTIGSETHALDEPFIVLATQNPIEQEGTYPLPEAQLDRFLFKVIVGYPSRDQEREIVLRHGHRTVMPRLEDFGLETIADTGKLVAFRKVVEGIRLSEDIVDYVVDIVRATRETPTLLFGGSPRSANMLATASRALAALQGRDFVIPDDVKGLILPALRHRVVLAPGAEIEGASTESVLKQILSEVPAPR